MIGDQNYSRSHAEQWSKSISENIADELKKLNLDDIKFVINITLLEKTDKCCSVSFGFDIETICFRPPLNASGTVGETVKSKLDGRIKDCMYSPMSSHFHSFTENFTTRLLTKIS